MALRPLDFDPFEEPAAPRLKPLDFDPFESEAAEYGRQIQEQQQSAIGDFARKPASEQTESLKAFGEDTVDFARSIPAGAVKGLGMAARGLGTAGESARRSFARPLRMAGLNDVADFIENPVQENFDLLKLLKRAGQETADVGEKIGVPEERQGFGTQVGEGLGQISGQIAAVLLSGGAASLTTTGMLYGQGVDQMEALREEHAPDRQDAMTDTGLLAGGAITALTERVGLDRLLERIPPNIKNNVLRQLTDISIAGGIEAAQEVAEGVLQRLTAIATIDPDIEVFEGVEDDAAVGGSVGAIARGLLNLALPGRHRSPTTTFPSAPLTPEEADNPLPNDLQSEGKAILETVARGEAIPDPTALPSKRPPETPAGANPPLTQPAANSEILSPGLKIPDRPQTPDDPETLLSESNFANLRPGTLVRVEFPDGAEFQAQVGQKVNLEDAGERLSVTTISGERYLLRPDDAILTPLKNVAEAAGKHAKSSPTNTKIASSTPGAAPGFRAPAQPAATKAVQLAMSPEGFLVRPDGIPFGSQTDARAAAQVHPDLAGRQADPVRLARGWGLYVAPPVSATVPQQSSKAPTTASIQASTAPADRAIEEPTPPKTTALDVYALADDLQVPWFEDAFDARVRQITGGESLLDLKPEQLRFVYSALRAAPNTFASPEVAEKTTKSVGQPNGRIVKNERVQQPVSVQPRFGGQTFSQARLKAQIWAKQYVRGIHRNDSTGWTISVDAGGIKKATSDRRSFRDLDVVAELPAILRNATLLRTEAPRAHAKGLKAMHVMASSIQYKGTTYGVTIYVREQTDGKRFYDQHSEPVRQNAEPQQLPAGAQSGPAQERVEDGLSEGVATSTNIGLVSSQDKQHATRQRGAEALIRRLQLEANLASTRNGIRLGPNQIREIENFIDFIGAQMFADLGLTIANGRHALGHFNFANSVITIFRRAIDDGAFSRTTIHELWHALSRALTPRDRQDVINAARRSREAWFKDNPWARAFYRESGANGGELVRFLDDAEALNWIKKWINADGTAKHAGMKGLVLISRSIGDAGEVIGGTVTMRWTRETYKHKNVDEFFAETLTDRYFDEREIQDDKARSIIGHLRDIWRRMTEAFKRLWGADRMNEIFRNFERQAYDPESLQSRALQEETPIEDGSSIPSHETGKNGQNSSRITTEQAARIAYNAIDVEGAGIASTKVAATIRGEDRELVQDLGIFAKFAVHPRTIATMSRPFARVYQTAVDQFHRRDEIISELTRGLKPYFNLSNEQKRRVNAALERGRLYGEVYGRGKDAVVASDPQRKAHIQSGETIKLNDTEKSAYWAVRRTMDKALDHFKSNILAEFGMPEGVESAADVMKALPEDADQRDRERYQNIARMIREIEQARLQGYIPFMRFGDVQVVVRRRVDIDQIDPLTGNPMEFETVETVSIEREGLGGLARQLLEKNRLGDIPAVRNAIDTAKARYGNDPNVEISAFQTGRAAPAGQVNLADLDMLAETARLDSDAWQRVRDALSKAIQSRGFRRVFFGSKNVPGYSTDFERAIADYVTGLGGYLARREFEEPMENALGQIPNTQPRLREYASRYRSYINDPKEEFSTLRQAGFLYFIAGNISTAALNLTQVPVFTMPYLAPLARNPLKLTAAFLKAYRQTAAMMRLKSGLDIFDPKVAPADVREVVQKAWDAGRFVPLQTHEMMGLAHNRSQMLRGLSKKARKAVDVAALTYSYAERINRIATFIATYRLARDNPQILTRAREVLSRNELARVEVLPGFSPETFAQWVVDETHFQLGKTNRPTLMRGAGAPLVQFKSFVTNALELQYREATRMGRPGKVAFGLTLMALMLTSGLFGLPGAEDITDFFELLYKKWTSLDLDVRTEVREIVTEMTGSPKVAELFAKGTLRMTGVDMAQRVGMGDLVPDTSSEAAGVPFSLTLGKAGQAMDYFKRGQMLEGVGETLPNFIRNPVHALSWTTSGVRSQSTGRVQFPADDITAGEITAKALGFTPARIANIRDAEWAKGRTSRSTNELRAIFYTRLARSIAEASRAEESGDFDQASRLTERVDAIFAEIDAHNVDAAEHEIIVLNPSTLRVRVAEEYEGLANRGRRSPRSTRERRLEIEEIYGVAP